MNQNSELSLWKWPLSVGGGGGMPRPRMFANPRSNPRVLCCGNDGVEVDSCRCHIEDTSMTGAELTDYIATDERWLRGQFAEDGWLVN